MKISLQLINTSQLGMLQDLHTQNPYAADWITISGERMLFDWDYVSSVKMLLKDASFIGGGPLDTAREGMVQALGNLQKIMSDPQAGKTSPWVWEGGLL